MMDAETIKAIGQYIVEPICIAAIIFVMWWQS